MRVSATEQTPILLVDLYIETTPGILALDKCPTVHPAGATD
jgi:hypothetical protein